MTTKIFSAKHGSFTNHTTHTTFSTSHITKGEDFRVTRKGVINLTGKCIPKHMQEDYQKRMVSRFVDRLGMNVHYCDTLPGLTKEDIVNQIVPIL